MLGLGVSLLVAGVACAVPGFGYPAAYQPTNLPLALIAESPYSMAKYSVDMPLLMVDGNSLPIIRNAEINGVSPTAPLVTCRTNNRYVTVSTASNNNYRSKVYMDNRDVSHSLLYLMSAPNYS